MLALIAGRGDLPTAVANALPTPPLVCSVESSPPQDLVPDLTFRPETIGTLIATLRDRGVTTLCMCGSIDRPTVDPARVDAATRPLAARLQTSLAKRDDGALRGVVALFEDAGIDVVGAHELVPELLPPAGLCTRTPLPDGIEADVAAAEAALSEMGRVDLGQACIVRGGEVLAREDDSGTDALIRRFALPVGSPIPDPSDLSLPGADRLGAAVSAATGWLTGGDGPRQAAPGQGAILFKAPKPGQDRRADLPTIGPDTAEAAAAAGLAAIVIEAGGVIVLDQARVVDRLDACGIALWVRAP